MKQLLELQKLYNERLKKYNKACEYIKNCSDLEYEKIGWLYRLRLGELSVTGNAIEEYTKRKMTDYETFNGFKL